MQTMEWEHLLNTDRIRRLCNGRESQRVPSELRDEVERDYGRCLYSTPVRRLKDKTQVFPLEENDSVRTRLAHSLEVSSVARSLGEHAARFISQSDDRFPESGLGAIAWIAATCGLIHDLGNPPFGHAGELAISSWFRAKLKEETHFFDDLGGAHSQYAKDFLDFEGNAQTLHLISHLQILSDAYGLNLTAASYSAACKYLARSSERDPTKGHAFAKTGYFASEEPIVNIVRSTTGTLDRRNPITYLVEAADDIVYSTVDLEDGVKKKILQWEQVQEVLQASSLARKMLNAANTRIKDNPPPPSVKGETLAQIFRTIAITEMSSIALDTFKRRYSLIMNGDYRDELIADPEAETSTLIEVIKKKILRPFLYTSPSILKLEILGRKVIHDLMTFFWEAASGASGEVKTDEYSGKLYLLISENYRRVFEKRLLDKERKEPEKYIRLQLVADHVAGMTDTYACHLHKELTNGAYA